jgi:hypothetical protein
MAERAESSTEEDFSFNEKGREPQRDAAFNQNINSLT